MSQQERAFAVFWTVLCATLITAGPAFGQAFDSRNVILEEAGAFAGTVDPALGWFASEEFRGTVEAKGAAFDQRLNRVVTFSHYLHLESGGFLHVREAFTLRSWLRRPERRAVLLLSPSAANSSTWEIHREGYNALEIVARRQMFAFAVDYIGVGESYKPNDGTMATRDTTLSALTELLRYIRSRRNVAQVDLLGEGYGGVLATQLAADARQVRTTTVNGTSWDQLPESFNRDAVLGLLSTAVDGYVELAPRFFGGFYFNSPAGVRDHMLATQAGKYPTPPMLAPVFEALPHYDPGVAKAPGLVLWGNGDHLATPGYPHNMASAYGDSGARVVVREGAGHYPRIESADSAAWYWRQFFAFVESH